jgi:hypothetical protein
MVARDSEHPVKDLSETSVAAASRRFHGSLRVEPVAPLTAQELSEAGVHRHPAAARTAARGWV